MSSIPFIQLEEDFAIPLGYYDNYSASINLSFPLFTSGKRRGAYRMALLGAEWSKEESEKEEDDLRETVYSSFYGLLVAQEGAEIAQGAVERAEDHLRTVTTQHQKGLVSQLDLLPPGFKAFLPDDDGMAARGDILQGQRALPDLVAVERHRRDQRARDDVHGHGQEIQLPLDLVDLPGLDKNSLLPGHVRVLLDNYQQRAGRAGRRGQATKNRSV